MKSVGNLNDLTSPPPSWNTLSDKLYRGKDIIGGFGRGAEENTLSCDSLFALLFIYIS
ncbi:hypothetical protein Bca4012_049924 [Brassica carinata]|nr:unnamed protein product [Brassica napus]CDY09451.1 BnaC02g19930D [Brassica napus]VDD22649.1 unnamed protein product [Brassica oleracea]